MSGSAVRAGRAFIEVFLKDQVTANLRGMTTRLQSMSRVIGGLGAGLLGAGVAIAAPLSMAVKSFASTGDAIHKMSGRTGIGAESLSALGFAAEQSGSSLGSVEKGVRGMQRTILDLELGLSTAKDGFNELGLSLEDVKGRSPDAQFVAIASRVAAIEDPSRRAAVALKVFGRAGTELLPLMNDGADGILNLMKQAEELGLVIDGKSAASAARLTDAMNALSRAVKGAVFRSMLELAPLISDVSEQATGVVVKIGNWLSQNGQLVVGVAKLAGVLAGAGVTFVGLAGAIYASSLPLAALATAASVTGAVLGALPSILGAVTGATLLKRAAMLTTAAANVIYTASLNVAKAAMIGVSGAIGIVRGGLAVLRAGFLAAGIAVGALTTATRVARTAFAATGVAVSAVTTAVNIARAEVATFNVHQTALGVGSAILRTVEAGWRGLTTTIALARAGISLAKVQQLAFGAGAAILNTVRAGWALLRGALVATSGSMSLVRAMSLTTSAALGVMSLVANGGAGAMTLLSGALAAVQAAAVGPLVPIALVAAGVAGLGAVLYINRESIFDFLGNSLESLKPILGSVAEQWKSFASGITSWFSDIVGEASIAWKGISAAIAVNDLQAAWTIAWNTMKIVALKTYGPIASAWNEFTTGVMSGFDGAIVGIRSGWNSAITFITQSMFSALGVIQDMLDRIAEFDPTGVADKLRGLLDIDTEGINAMLDEDNNKFKSDLEQQRQERDAERGSDLAEKQAALAKSIAEADEAIRKVRDKAVSDVVEKDTDQKYKSLFGDTDAKTEEPFDQQSAFDEAMAGLEETNRGTSGASSPDIAGTFSSVAAAMMAAGGGGQSTEQELLNANKEQLKKQDKLIQFTGDMARALEAAWTVG